MKITLSHPLLLASNSPRRKQLLESCGFEFTVSVRPTDETYSADMPPADIPAFLARQKAEQFRHDAANRLVLCADTIVVRDNEILNKPIDQDEARQMLRCLSGTTHRVITGVCLLANDNFLIDTDTALVTFRVLRDSEIEAYIQSHSPYDKAGGYGIQDWIGMVGIERIEGSYYTIMGLPTHRVYQLLAPYILA